MKLKRLLSVFLFLVLLYGCTSTNKEENQNKTGQSSDSTISALKKALQEKMEEIPYDDLELDTADRGSTERFDIEFTDGKKTDFCFVVDEKDPKIKYAIRIYAGKKKLASYKNLKSGDKISLSYMPLSSEKGEIVILKKGEVLWKKQKLREIPHPNCDCPPSPTIRKVGFSFSRTRRGVGTDGTSGVRGGIDQ